MLDGSVLLSEKTTWLAGVLKARDFPIERLARDLEIASEIVKARSALADVTDSTADCLAASAATVAGLATEP